MGEKSITSRFNEIYDATNKRALSFITAKCGNIDDINDILQETYMELYKVLNAKGAEFIENDEAFVIQIAKQKVFRHYTALQKAKSKISLTLVKDDEEIDLLGEIPDEMDLEEEIVNSALVEEIQQLLRKRPQDIRKIFFMRFSLDMSIKEIAGLMELSESSVKNKLYRTINEIRKYYGKGAAI